MSKAIYAMSADPITFGHLDIIKRASIIFDELVVGIGVNPSKNYLFSLEERTYLTRQALSKLNNVEVKSFQGLLVDFAYESGADAIVKGVRNPTDFAYETNLLRLGDSQDLGIDTMLLIANPKLAHVSSSAVKQIQKEQGLIHEYVPLNVKQALEEKISSQHIVIVTGEIGVGKSYVSEQFCQLGEKMGLEVHNIELDNLTHQIYQELPQAKYKQIRNTIADNFGQELKNEDGSIDRQGLGEIVFDDYEKLTELNEIMKQPLLVRIRRELYGKKGLILLNAALVIETEMTYLANNNVCLIKADKEIQKQRLMQRDLDQRQIERRIGSQYNFTKKKSYMKKMIERDQFGHIWTLDNSIENKQDNIKAVFSQMLDYFKLKSKN
ncbi:MAG: pantetheine-phosphate adenylyltransferase [Patescibacteria group bacterium]|nr:pantetheine-phosphate adenylyltransferase [Patescibacteria group bacterium]